MSPRTCTKAACLTGNRRRNAGVSLIEALLALVVMSLGMLAVVGVQATLRANGDLSRQRAEAVRLAQEALEDWRIFTSVTAVAGARDYTDIVSTPSTNITPAGANATYTLTRDVVAVPASGSPPLRTFAVTVEWVDRSGETQRVQLFSSIARVPPAIAASLSVPSNGGPALRPMGRHVAIPRGAGPSTIPGRSTFEPPQPRTSTSITTLEFNNLTGEIVEICVTIRITQSRSCNSDRAQLLTGFLRGPAIPSIGMQVEYRAPPSSTAVNEPCFIAEPQLDPAEYFCVIRAAPVANVMPPWTGRVEFFSTVNPLLPLVGCRYDASLNRNPIPYPYTDIVAPLGNQNFFVTPTPGSCPTDTVQI